MAFHFLPRDEQFFSLFEDAARNITESALVLHSMVEDFVDVEGKADRIRALEERGDEITFQIIARLGKRLITPIEREDIFAIARGLDDIADLIEASAARLSTYAIDEPTEQARRFAGLILQASRELETVMALFHQQSVEKIRMAKMAVNRMESEGDQLLRRSVAGLFTSGQDALTVIKWKEIYETLEAVTDRQEALANLIEGIIVKNT